MPRFVMHSTPSKTQQMPGHPLRLLADIRRRVSLQEKPDDKAVCGEHGSACVG